MTVDQEEGLCMDNFHWDDLVEEYRFECVVGTSNKFYEVELLADSLDDNEVSHPYVMATRYGSMRPNAHITEKRVGYPNRLVAQQTVENKIRTRIDHGYRKVKEVRSAG